jgi:creatinine amidohydrolase/Fe(II)-dependent formamide hydrolase-like protein
MDQIQNSKQMVQKKWFGIVEWLYHSGIKKVLLLNGHMRNWGPIYSARQNIFDLPDLKVLDY